MRNQYITDTCPIKFYIGLEHGNFTSKSELDISFI